jgi:DMSO/TMAO reductase YedYZ molybdopterin-dependent catalytic subunit
MLVGFRWQTGRVPDRDLLVISEEPLNAETRLDEKTPAITPAGKHYVRTHFPIPTGPRSIVIDGAGTGPPAISLDEIRSLPTRSMVVTLECAGNGRRFLDPKVPGEQWGLGAVGTATWTGASLRDVLRTVEIPSGTVELLVRGADEGVPKDLGRRIGYERSLPIDVALGDDILVAHLMEGLPIPREHGGPLRLIVPGWYGMASVKWLAEIRLIDRPFDGFFQQDRYVIEGRQLQRIEPRAVITSPRDGAAISGGSLEVRGYAWSGQAPLDRVELFADGERALGTMTASADAPRFAWNEFVFRISLDPGEHDLVARAVDCDDNRQPMTPKWNSLGYANNAVQPVRIRVRG